MSVMFRASVEITVMRNGKILAVTNRKWGGFSAPGGKVEKGETLLDAARRELYEETGCEAIEIREIAGKVHLAVPKDGDQTQWFCTGFVADIGDQEPRQMEEGTRPFWTTREDLIENSMYGDWYCWLFRLIDKLDA